MPRFVVSSACQLEGKTVTRLSIIRCDDLIQAESFAFRTAMIVWPSGLEYAVKVWEIDKLKSEIYPFRHREKRDNPWREALEDMKRDAISLLRNPMFFMWTAWTILWTISGVLFVIFFRR